MGDRRLDAVGLVVEYVWAAIAGSRVREKGVLYVGAQGGQ